MKEKIKIFLNQNWMRMSIFIISLIIIGGAFYWFQLRPSHIYSNCYKKAVEAAIKKCTDCSEGRFKIDDYDTYYKMCLRKYGINK